jgi:type I restriction enzyme S subunit
MEAIIDYRGKTPTKTLSGIPLITAKIVKGGRINKPEEYISIDDFDIWMRRGMPHLGDVVITTEAPLGEVAQLGKERVALAQRIITLRGKPEVLDNTFLKFLMMSQPIQNQIHARSSGTTVLGFKQAELRKISLTLPTINEQRAIAHILGTLDDKIELNRRMNDTLEAMARALFKSWFVDFDPVHAKAAGRDPGLPKPNADLFPDSFEDSDLGGIPRGWSIKKIHDLCKAIYSGGTPSTQNPNYWGGEIPWLSSGETREKFITRTEKRITPDGVANSSTKRAPSLSTVIASAGQGNTRGQTSLLTIESFVNQSVVVLTADLILSSPFHLFFDLERRYEEFRRISDAHSSRGSLTTKLIAGLPVVLPPIQVIRRFDLMVMSAVQRITNNLNESRTLADLRDTLLPKLISGEVRIENPNRFLQEVS